MKIPITKINLKRSQVYKRQIIQQTSFSTKQLSQKGLTLIECLVAIAVIAATMGVIAPVTILAVATRVQNQRFVQASNLAQAEVDRVKVAVARGGNYTAEINTRVAQAPAGTAIEAVSPPASMGASSVPVPSSTNIPARAVDIDNDGDADFAIQVFRTNDTDGEMVTSATGEIAAFQLGVRVYRAKAFETIPTGGLGVESASLSFTSGEGQSTTRPLAVVYSTITKSDEQESLCDYHQYASTATSTMPDFCSP